MLTAIITATEITRTGGIYVQIDLCVPRDTCHELFCVWGFLSVKDAGCRGNKITAVHNLHNKQVFYSRVTLQLLLRQTM